MKHFGKMIQDACRAQGVSNSDLARALGHERSWVPQLFASKNIKESTLRECAQVLDLDVVLELAPRANARRRIEMAKKVQAQPRLRRANGR